jgi:hypothetical protein
MESRVPERKRKRTRDILQMHAPSDLLHPNKPHLLTFPSLPNLAIKLRTQLGGSCL